MMLNGVHSLDLGYGVPAEVDGFVAQTEFPSNDLGFKAEGHRLDFGTIAIRDKHIRRCIDAHQSGNVDF